MSDNHLNVKNKITNTYRQVYSYFKPIPTSSSFVKTGTLTPTEFVDAGDFLVHRFKTWEWQHASKNKTVSYLPKDKQFLLTRNAPCKQRIKSLNHITQNMNLLDNEWIHINYEKENNDIDINEYVHNDDSFTNDLKKEENDSNDDNETIDINNSDVEYSMFKEENDSASVDPNYNFRNEQNDNILKTRTYDISITYDKYYQTPRIWLFGYNEIGTPLTSDEIFEDILTDYSYKTVTYDPHPCTGIMTASIHPCKHSEIMLKIVNQWVDENKEPRHDLYLLFLLKFISGVIPTIEYDYTTDIELPGRNKQ